jgi:hypothetical protein
MLNSLICGANAVSVWLIVTLAQTSSRSIEG